MQANNSPRFVKRFMIGLIASGAGAFVALPGSAMPEPGETVGAVEETTEAADVAPVETIVEPTAEETLPVANAVEEAIDEAEAAVEEAVEATDEAVEEAAADTDEAVEEAAADVDEAVEETVADTEATEAEPVTEADALMEVEPVADTEMTDDVVEADAVTEAEPAADAEMTEVEPVAEEPVAEEPVAEEPVAEEPVAEEPVEASGDVVTEDVEASEGVATEDMNTTEFTIAELTNLAGSFQVLSAALEAAELSEVLSGEGPFTVFAPTDEAFANLPEGMVEQLLLPENKAVLTQILTYHVVPGTVLSTDLETGNVATVEGGDLMVDVGEKVTVNSAEVLQADIAASNGVIHVIDRVIVPLAPEADADVSGAEAIQ